VLSFAAWTPKGGPLYAVKTNTKITGDIVQQGRFQLGATEEA
jgi:hypothetical protein